DRMDRLIGHFKALLQAVVSEPNLRLSNIPILTNPECRRLIEEWNDTAREYPEERSIHELIQEQAVRTPEAVAAVFEDEKITYARLDARSNQLARYLRKRGIGPESLVGLCIERSLDMVVGLLGILKAGGAYVPLDPT